mgnify:CR=1 FL=1
MLWWGTRDDVMLRSERCRNDALQKRKRRACDPERSQGPDEGILSEREVQGMPWKGAGALRDKKPVPAGAAAPWLAEGRDRLVRPVTAATSHTPRTTLIRDLCTIIMMATRHGSRGGAVIHPLERVPGPLHRCPPSRLLQTVRPARGKHGLLINQAASYQQR